MKKRVSDIIEGVSEAIRFVQDNWVDERNPVWSGDIHEFMANVRHEDVTIFDVAHVLSAIAEGIPIDGMESVVAFPYKGKIQRVEIRRKSSSKNRAKKNLRN